LFRGNVTPRKGIQSSEEAIDAGDQLKFRTKVKWSEWMLMSDVGDGLDAKAAEEQARVGRQLERVLAHSSFRNSRRYQAFLRYVVEEKFRDNGVHLKERTIGVSVFQQPLNYDTNANSVVRVTAGEIRRRLAQYYLEANLEDEILIELPVGSYVPKFHIRGAAPPPETILLDLERQVPSGGEEPSKQEILVVQESALPPKPAAWSRKAIALFVGSCLLPASFAVAFATREGTTSENDRIWKGAFGSQNVLLCGGSLDTARRSESDSQVHHSYLGFSFTTARTALIIGAAIGHTGGNAFLLPEQDTKFEDLQRSPAVLIGAFNNEWTLRLQSPLRYQFFRSPDGSLSGIVDTKNPGSKRFMIDRSLPDQPTRDYGIVAHFQSPTTGQSTVIAAGLAMHGTAAVRMFLSSPELLKEFSKSAPSGWEKRNYEIVLASDLVNNLADPPKVVDAYFW
jgi:hypothetical protein